MEAIEKLRDLDHGLSDSQRLKIADLIEEQRERLVQFANAFDAGYASADRAIAERAGGVKVKALGWEEISDHEPGWWVAQDDNLPLCCEVRVNSRGVVRARFPGKTWETFDGNTDAAKAAAQADYERRIRSALTSEPAAPEERQVVGDEPFEVLPDGSYQRRTRPAEQAVTEAWRPIETAPTDGTSILGAHEHAAIVVYWQPDRTENGAPGWADGETDMDGYFHTFPVTHWMPLPPLPALRGDAS